MGVRLTPAEGDYCHNLVAITAEKTFPVVWVPRDYAAHLWRQLPGVFAFAHDLKFNHQHCSRLVSSKFHVAIF